MPRRRGPRLYTLLATVACFLGGARVAHADNNQQCVVASEKAQQLRNASKLSEAREQLLFCARPECPKLIQQDCTEWMKEVLGILPSVVPSAKDKKGRDVVQARVLVDGKVVTETLDGKAVPIDPGVHTFRFETKLAPAIEEQIVVRQGEKNRILTVTFATADEPAATGVTTATVPPATTTTPPPAETPEKSSPPYAAYVAGGIGILALGAALYIDLDANADARELRDTCAPRCDQSKVDDVDNRYVIAGVTAALGGAALIAGVILFFTHSSGTRPSASRLLPAVAPLSRGVAAIAGFRF